MRIYKSLPTYKRLREVINYDPLTGEFTWKNRPVKVLNDQYWNRRFSGKPAGVISKKGQREYRMICIDNITYFGHRLAFLLMKKREPYPGYEIDHIKGWSNIWTNLREVTHDENQQNTGLRKNNKSGIPGVKYQERYHRWTANIQVNGKAHWIGSFTVKKNKNGERTEEAKEIAKEEAIAAYKEIAIELQGEYVHPSILAL